MAWELTTWKPLREFESMRSEMDRLWDSFFVGKPRKRADEEGHWLPSVDVSETKNDVVVKVELPGMNPKDLDISLSDGSSRYQGRKETGERRARKKTIISSRGATAGLSEPFLFRRK